MSVLSIAAFFAILTSSSPQPAQWPLWNSYATHFIQDDGRVVDPDRENITTSEGQSYAMFFALVANDRVRYDQVYKWVVNNLSAGDLQTHLPSWSWGRRPDNTFGTLDDNSASDSDLWIAYDLIQAGHIWHQSEYSKAGQALLARIATEEVIEAHGFPILLPGRTGFVHDERYLSNPSYMPLFLLQAAAYTSPNGPWKRLAASLPKLLHQSSILGFAPDWMELDTSGTSHAAVPSDSTEAQPVGSYDAIRVYLWAGLTAPGAPHRAELLKELTAMTETMKIRSMPPEKITNSPEPFKGNAPISFSAALVPFLNAVNEPQAAATQQQRLQKSLSAGSGLYGDPPRYYDQNLAMFSLGFTENRYRILPNGDLEVSWAK